MSERETVSIMQACEICKVSRRTIYNWINAGKLAYRRSPGGLIRIFTDSLWMDKGRHAPAAKTSTAHS